MVKNVVFWIGLGYAIFLVAFRGANIFITVGGFLLGYWMFSWVYAELARSLMMFAAFSISVILLALDQVRRIFKNKWL
jgi:hypothetical protein